MRGAGLVYVAYFVLSAAGAALRNVPLQVVATASYFVLAVVLYRLFAPADPVAALALLPLALVGCVIQAFGQVQGDAGVLRLALVPFGLFLVVLGYLIARSAFGPLALGALLVVAGLAWPIAVIPGAPSWSAAVAVALGIVAEGALAIWLLVAGR
jgi:hypothetical protein